MLHLLSNEVENRSLFLIRHSNLKGRHFTTTEVAKVMCLHVYSVILRSGINCSGYVASTRMRHE